jgi:hypothetical protein
MKTSFGLRGGRLAAATLGIFAVAGGIAYASIPDGAGVYHACLMKNGTIRIIDPATSQCNAANETEITFGQQGPKGDPGSPGAQGAPGAPGSPGTNGTNGTNGADGKSPTVVQLAAGDQHCPAGGAAITDAAGTTAYVCSGANGQNGADGTPFSGTFTSPNGKYKLSVTDTGVTLVGADTTLALTDTGMRVDAHGSSSITLMSSNNLTLRSAVDGLLESGLNLSVRGGATTNVEGGATLALKGAGGITLNDSGSSCLLVARLGDSVLTSSSNNGATSTGFITSGAPTVCVGG